MLPRFPRHNAVDLPAVAANRVDASAARAIEVHAGQDELQLQAGRGGDGLEDRTHQAEFGTRAADEANASCPLPWSARFTR